LRYIWDTDEQREIIASIVQHALSQASETETASAHPRSANQDAPNADELMRDLDLLASTWKNGDLAEPARSSIRDQLGLLSGRCQWISDRIQREHVERRVSELWKELGTGA
jgi:MoxR-like ATPase